MRHKNNITTPVPLTSEIFAKTVIDWQLLHGRHNLPWQVKNQPYHVLVSEIMLQQTQVSTVIPYFNNWLKLFPDFSSLANATEDDVLSAWQGLGYYSRARNLHRAAQYVISDCGGQLPDSPELLREVPGVGPYTAGAITAFAFNKPAAIVDGNVKRLFARYFGIEGDISSSASNTQLWQLAESYTPSTDSRSYAQGLLDLGATVCSPRSPLCQQCPLNETCNALVTNRVDTLPMRKKKATIPTKNGYFVLDTNQQGILLEQRPGNGIWPRLWCLPECAAPLDQAKVHGTFKHVFSHYRLNATVYKANAMTDSDNPPLLKRFSPADLMQVGLPAPIRKYLDTKLQNDD